MNRKKFFIAFIAAFAGAIIGAIYKPSSPTTT
jgi:hypothetical protein